MKPILMNTENVRAILEGRKTVTRRVVRPQPKGGHSVLDYDDEAHTADILCGNGGEGGVFADWAETAKAPYWPGDILWVRETWNCLPIPEPLKGTSKTYWYRADGAEPRDKWRSPYHMPREAARIFLRVTGVRVERLRDMTLADVLMEGIKETDEYEKTWDRWHQAWNQTIKPADLPTYGWAANPWVWVIIFERISREEATHDE